MEARVMKWLLLTVVAATLAATAEAAVVPGCCSEGRWRAKYWAVSPSTTPSTVYINMFHKDVTYDAPNQRTVELLTTNPAKKPKKILKFYQTGVGYSYDPNTGVCDKEAVAVGKFPKICTSGLSKVIDRNVTTKVGNRLVNATRLQFHSHTSDFETVDTRLVKNDNCITLTKIFSRVGSAGVSMVNEVMVELNDELWCEEDFKIPEACKRKAWNSGREAVTAPAQAN